MRVIIVWSKNVVSKERFLFSSHRAPTLPAALFSNRACNPAHGSPTQLTSVSGGGYVTSGQEPDDSSIGLRCVVMSVGAPRRTRLHVAPRACEFVGPVNGASYGLELVGRLQEVPCGSLPISTRA